MQRLILALGVFGLFLGCRAANPAEAPPLVAISNFVHPPFSSRNEAGEAVGIEVELVAAAARELGREVVWRDRAFGELIGAVAAGEADFAAATLGITDERSKLVTFSDSYHSTSVVALVRIGDGEPMALADLTGRIVATDPGTTGVAAIRTTLPNATLRTERDADTSWGALLAAGEVDAVVIDESHAETFMSNAGTRFHVIAEPLAEEHFGIATQHGATELREALNAAIRR